ncbi:MAG: phosphatase PAP2/dual specificity phosphatase family protein [Methylotenera sp.]|uniref:phosphatase PAP2/dual specificity phosphatase family protein n=1 Tax=Methylotenera sp. TaxID=2051956 RepID=UPI002487F26B|nr:phosphatase PAP2/dual specificity phosphatase family protein [Methylotenera sp.]MDI1310055.1 phosphatase PAP2/dual specificity phosphatase family protein [Methylotenera sp.]
MQVSKPYILKPAILKPPILWKRGAIWLALLGPFFFLSYGWLNYYTSGRTDVGIMVEVWEHLLPFVPWLMLPYMSIDAFYAGSLFLFRKRSALDRHALRLLLATVISLIGFLLYPLQFSFDVPKADDFNGVLQAILLGFDKPYNQAPSLHISLLIVLWELYAKRLQGYTRIALHLWFIAIAASVLLVYQHHFIDVWTGALVGVACLYLIPDQPFSWRWQQPTARMKQLALRYGLLAVTMTAAAILVCKHSVLLAAIFIWTSIALLLVSFAYWGFEQQIFQRDSLSVRRGNMRWPAKFLLAPYLLLSWCSYRMYTKRRYLPNKIHGNVWLGAFPRAAVAKLGVSWHGVLDLTNEFPASLLKAPIQKHLPVLDLTPPKPKTLVRAVRWLERTQQQGDILVHCALGLSRSSSVVACWLVWRGHAANVQHAIAMIDATRAGIVLSKEYEANIQQALKELG